MIILNSPLENNKIPENYEELEYNSGLKYQTSENSITRQRRYVEGDASDSFLLRHIRSLTDEVPATISPSIFNITNNTNAKSEPSDTIFVTNFTVPANTTEIVIRNLTHFTLYRVTLRACRDPENDESDTDYDGICSAQETIHIRTQKLGESEL